MAFVKKSSPTANNKGPLITVVDGGLACINLVDGSSSSIWSIAFCDKLAPFLFFFSQLFGKDLMEEWPTVNPNGAPYFGRFGAP